MKLGTLVKFPTTGLDMNPFLAPRSSSMSSRPSSATPLSTYKTQRTPKSVHFEDEAGEAKKSPLGRSVSVGKGKGKRFLFPWRKQQSAPADKKERRRERRHTEASSTAKKSTPHSRSHSLEGRQRSRSPEPSHRSYSPPAGSESPMSIRSAPSTINRHQLQPHHRYFLPPSPLHHLSNSASLDEPKVNNVYDLFAVCNHTGTLSRGHYTAFCKNPADGRWYSYDDTTVQPIAEEQLVTAGAYMLFYVSQSLISSSPLSSSESSQSSCSSTNHWIYHMPPFKLDLNDYHEELCQLQAQQSQRQQSQLSQQSSDNHLDFAGEVKPRSRLGSANSMLSAPSNVVAANSIGSCVSPPVSAHDVDSFTSPGSGSVVNSHFSNHDARSDAFSAVSLPPYRGRLLNNSVQHAAPSYNHAIAYSSRNPSTRHQSLRLGRGRESSGGWVEERGWVKEVSGRTAQRSYSTQMSHEGVHKSISQTFEAYNGPHPQHIQGYVVPTQSIPSLPTHEEIALTPNRYSQEPQHSFMNPHLHRQTSAVSNGHIPNSIGSHFMSPSLAHGHPESCV